MLQSQTMTPGFVWHEIGCVHRVIEVSSGGGFRRVLPPDVDKRGHPELQLCRDSVRIHDDIRQLQQARQQHIQVCSGLNRYQSRFKVKNNSKKMR